MNGISLIVATLNRTDELARFIHSLRPASDLSIDLIIVDQNQDERIAHLLRSLPIPAAIRIQHLPFDRSNQSLARNYGLTKARYELIGFPDDDCWYEPGTLDAVMNAFREQPGTDVVVGHWVERPEKVPAQPTSVTADSLRSFRAVPTSAIVQFFRRQALPHADPFDPRFGAYKEHGGYFGCGEETDLMMSIAKHGCAIQFIPAIRVHHRYTARRFDSLQQQFSFTRHRARGTGGLYAKHRVKAFVVARGIVAPFIRSLLSISTPDKCVTQAGLLVGRMEGFFRWRSRYKS